MPGFSLFLTHTQNVKYLNHANEILILENYGFNIKATISQ